MVQAYWGGVSHGPGILGRSVPWSKHWGGVSHGPSTGEECHMVQAYWGGVSHGPGTGEEYLASLGSKERVISSKEGTSLCMTRKERTSMHDKVQRLLSI